MNAGRPLTFFTPATHTFQCLQAERRRSKSGEESGMEAYILLIKITASRDFHIVAFYCHLQTEHEKFKGEADARVAAAAEEAMALREQLDAAQV